MSLLRVIRMALVAVIVLGAIVFTVKNPSERVRLDLVFFPAREGVLLIEALFWALLGGIVVGMSFAALRLLELQTQLSGERRQRQRLQSELTALRNLPLEDAASDEGTGGGA
jgi:uncharacterized integral membrane protein